MTPLPNQPDGTPKFRYNEALCKARNPIERLFGVLKGTWRCLSQQRILLYEPGFAGRIVNACSVLHNIRLQEYETDDTDNTGEIHFIPEQQILGIDDNSPSSIAKRIQNRIITNYFS